MRFVRLSLKIAAWVKKEGINFLYDRIERQFQPRYLDTLPLALEAYHFFSSKKGDYPELARDLTALQLKNLVTAVRRHNPALSWNYGSHYGCYRRALPFTTNVSIERERRRERWIEYFVVSLSLSPSLTQIQTRLDTRCVGPNIHRPL